MLLSIMDSGGHSRPLCALLTDPDMTEELAEILSTEAVRLTYQVETGSDVE